MRNSEEWHQPFGKAFCFFRGSAWHWCLGAWSWLYRRICFAGLGAMALMLIQFFFFLLLFFWRKVYCKAMQGEQVAYAQKLWTLLLIQLDGTSFSKTAWTIFTFSYFTKDRNIWTHFQDLRRDFEVSASLASTQIHLCLEAAGWTHFSLCGLFATTLLMLFPIMGYLSYSIPSTQFNSVHFSHSVMSYSLWPHEPQHARPPCPSPTPGVHPNPCPLCQWCHPTISSSVVPFSSCPQSSPASGSFPMSQLFTSGGISIRISASASVLPMNIQDLSLGWTGWISLQFKGLSRVFSNTTVQMFNSSVLSFLYSPTLLSYTHLFWCGVLYVLSTFLLDL